jgi:hypothetical protein
MFLICANTQVSYNSSHFRWIYRRNIVVDGNFSLEHMKMKSDADDVFLNDGEGYMVEWIPYKQHLEDSIETKQVISHLTHC